MLDKNQLPIESLFDMARFPLGLSFGKRFLLIMYVPLGIFILVIRLCLLIIWFVTFFLIPRTQKIKRITCKGACAITGVLHSFKNEHHLANLNVSPRFIVSNHTYTFEFFPFITKYWCLITARKTVLEHWLLLRTAFLLDITVVNDVKSKYDALSKHPDPIFIFPEGATTNGKVGLLKYHPLIFGYGETILPIATKITRPLPIACCKLNFAVITDFLWLLYSPWTLCEYTILPLQKILPGESSDEFAKRVQIMTADALGLIATDFTVDDKKKLREMDLHK